MVDDDKDLTASVQSFLVSQSQVVEVCHSAEDAAQLLQAYQYELILLDWNLPGMTGEDLCRQYRRKGGQTPIIFLTGMSDIDSIEAGLNAGADDYMVKPFDIRELNARVKSSLKRRTGVFKEKLEIRDVVLDQENSCVIVGDMTVRLRAKEAALLEFLMKHPNRIYSAQQLLDAVWPSDAEGSTDGVRTWINLLRKKLTLVNRADLVRTVLGSGYVIEDESGTV